MKKIITFILSALMIISFVSCRPNLTPSSGVVMSKNTVQAEKTVWVDNDDGETYSIETYNSNGIRVIRDVYSNSDVLQSHSECDDQGQDLLYIRYEENGNVSYKTETTYTNDDWSKVSNSYNPDGSVQSTYTKNKDGDYTNLYYYDDGTLSREEMYDSETNTSKEIWYAANGVVDKYSLKQYHTDKRSVLTSKTFSSDDEPLETVENEYGENDNILKRTTITNDFNGESTFIEAYEYDANNEILTIKTNTITLDYENTVVYEHENGKLMRFIRTIPAEGRKMIKTYIDSNVSTETKKLEYYKDDVLISTYNYDNNGVLIDIVGVTISQTELMKFL